MPFRNLQTLGRRHKFACEKFIFHTYSCYFNWEYRVLKCPWCLVEISSSLLLTSWSVVCCASILNFLIRSSSSDKRSCKEDNSFSDNCVIWYLFPCSIYFCVLQQPIVSQFVHQIYINNHMFHLPLNLIAFNVDYTRLHIMSEYDKVRTLQV